MKRILYAAALGAALPASAQAATLLTVDLSVANEITITATANAASASVSGSDTTGVYLEGFFGSGAFSIGPSLVAGDLTSAQNTSDGSPNLFNSNGGEDGGLNLWSYTNDATGEFVAGSRAFSGSATWTVSEASYLAALAGASSGALHFPADTIDDLTSATRIGEWEKVSAAVVPLPAGAWLLGAALLGLGTMGRRRHG